VHRVPQADPSALASDEEDGEEGSEESEGSEGEEEEGDEEEAEVQKAPKAAAKPVAKPHKKALNPFAVLMDD
jgi:hypothetical protein